MTLTQPCRGRVHKSVKRKFLRVWGSRARCLAMLGLAIYASYASGKTTVSIDPGPSVRSSLLSLTDMASRELRDWELSEHITSSWPFESACCRAKLQR